MFRTLAAIAIAGSLAPPAYAARDAITRRQAEAILQAARQDSSGSGAVGEGQAGAAPGTDAAAPQLDQLADAVARRVEQRLAAQLASLACPLPASPVRSPPPTSAPGRPRASRPLVWSGDLAAAQHAAAAAGKPVLAYFTMKGCRACEQLEQLHRDPAVAAAILERYVPVRLRYEDSPAEFRRFRVSVAPTLVVLRGSSTLARKSGATDQRAYLEWLRRPHAAP